MQADDKFYDTHIELRRMGNKNLKISIFCLLVFFLLFSSTVNFVINAG